MQISQLIVRLICFTGLCTPACSRQSSNAADLSGVAAWAVEEELRIGSVNDPEIGFSSIGGMVLDGADTLYVLDAHEREIRVFDNAGQHIRSFARRGAGPGELESPFDFGLVGDTLWISEMGGNQRLTLFSTKGVVIGTVPALPRVFTGRTGGVRVILVPGSLEPGGILPSRHSSTVIGSDTVVVPRIRFGLDGGVLDTVGWDTIRMGSSRRPPMRIAGVTGSQPSRPSLFNDEPIRAAQSRLLIERPLASSPQLGIFTVTRTDTTGDTVWTRAFRYRPLSPAPEHINEAVAIGGEIFRLRGVDSLVVDREIRQVLEIPPFLPPVTQVRMVDDEVWLRRENVLNVSWHWIVLDSDGQPVGAFALPRSFTPRIFAADKVWGVELDELDVPWVVRYGISRK